MQIVDGFEWFPWDRYNEVDRGFGTPCFEHARGPIPRKARRLRVYEVAHGERVERQVFMHLCEKYGERSYCMNPAHVRRASQGENLKHHHDLRREAGVPHPRAGKSNPQSPEWVAKRAAANRGRKFGPEFRDVCRERATGVVQTEETKARRSASLRARSLCPACGREWSAVWMTRHKNEGRCIGPDSAPLVLKDRVGVLSR